MTPEQQLQLKALCAVGTPALIMDLVLHGGWPGLVAGGAAALIAAKNAPDIADVCKDFFPVLPVGIRMNNGGSGRTFWDRAWGRFPSESEYEERNVARIAREVERESEEMARNWEEMARRGRPDEDDALPPPPTQRSGKFLFSQVLDRFTPTLDKIYLATLMNGTDVFCKAEDLCHVALAGNTGAGKTSLIRMLTAQLCKAGASVLLLNPHYTRYDIKRNEDWTPFEHEGNLTYDPMECRKYEVIEYYLHYVAKTLLPQRLEKFAHSQPWGRPYFLVLDELPSIVSRIKKAPEYLSFILREGRKVDIFLISASQDFLVKTVGGEGGGAVRDCYRTAYYGGGDPTTARVLLDTKSSSDIAEDELGKGVVMLRCAGVDATKKAIQCRVPYVDNESLYRLLGRSTYQPAAAEPDTDELPDLSMVLSPVLGPSQDAQRRAYELASATQDHHSRPVPAVPETQQNAPVEPVTMIQEQTRTGSGMPSQARTVPFVAGPNDRQFTQAQERQFLRLVERQPGLGPKDYLRLMTLGNSYAKYAGYVLRTKVGKEEGMQ